MQQTKQSSGTEIRTPIFPASEVPLCRYCREAEGHEDLGSLDYYPYKGKDQLFHKRCYEVGIPLWIAAAHPKEPTDARSLRDIFFEGFEKGVEYYDTYSHRPDIFVKRPSADNRSMYAWGKWIGFEAAKNNDLHGTPATPTSNALSRERRHYLAFMAQYRPNDEVYYDRFTQVHYYGVPA